MRKELPGTYTPLEGGAVGVRARTVEGGQVAEYEIARKDLILNVSYTDSQGTSHAGRVILQPVVSEVTRVDTLLPKDFQLLYLAASVCYSSLPGSGLIQRSETVEEGEADRLIRELVGAKHLSVIEHRGPAFLIGGISRACSHQLVRHRLLSFSQRSQRWVDYASGVTGGGEVMSFPFIIPPNIRARPELLNEFLSGIREAISKYYALRNGGVEPEDARFLLPNATATMMVVSGNRRVWLEIGPKRTCARAQWEIDIVITEIMRNLWQEMPGVYDRVGPACSLGRCDQGKRGCGVPLDQPLSAFFDQLEYPHDRLIFGMR